MNFFKFICSKTELLLKNGGLTLEYVAKRIWFRNGERHSILPVPNGIPVHEVTVYLDKYRRNGRAANTIHFVYCSLALLFRELDKAKVKLLNLIAEGKFLTIP